MQDGETALLLVSGIGLKDVMTLLLDHGADPKAQNKVRFATVLMLISEGGRNRDMEGVQ